MSDNVKNDWSKRDVGALWKREGKNQKYLSGYVKIDELGIEREVKIVVFSNKNKNNNEKAPDYRIYISTPLEASNSSNKVENTKVSSKPTKTNLKNSQQNVEDNQEEIL